MLIVNTRYYTNVMFDARNQNVENLTLPENVLSNFEFVIIGMISRNLQNPLINQEDLPAESFYRVQEGSSKS
jgi:hypothetical protein